MKHYVVELTTPKLEHIVKYEVEANSLSAAATAARKEYDWAKPVTVKAVRLVKNPEASYDDKVKCVELTNKQWHMLTTFLLMTTKYRERERNAWEDMSKEMEPDGVTPKYKNAASNVAFWSDMIAQLDTIQKAIDNA